MTQTPPAADGGLPGPLPWRADYTYDGYYLIAADGKIIDGDVASAWINAQSAIIAEKDAEIADVAFETMQRINRIVVLEAQLAAATSRLASAEKIMRGFIASYSNNPDGFDDAFRAARAWLASKDGKKQP